MRHSAANKRWAVVMGYDRSEAVGTLTEITTELDQTFRARWGPSLDSQIQLEPAAAVFGNDGPPLAALSTEPTSAGGRSMDTPPANVTLIVSKRTEFAGRAYRGRAYLPGQFNEDEVDEMGVITTPRLVAAQGIANAWLDDLAGSSAMGWPAPLVLLHGPPAFGGSAPAPTPVTALQVQGIVGTQRRRIR